ncbi:hypothetical protein SAMN04488107_4446 [Geodermatophilus saharensis]|uniref:Uncharacterized protein n=1 Tax=Geodermatophilus saharensis TaxID=1137994 RepID=A0A239IRE9_9ACTN|nr:hypothetical protein [Geodermatophilus saharensis]SNS96139.1 hypothetical protein SAMN04488107_4446 [Geodermatophilus saharensis]
MTTAAGNGRGDKELTDALRQFLAYPVQTQATAPAREREDGGSGDLQDSVDRVIGDVLGWRRRPGRIDGVLSALEQAFEPYEKHGRVLYRRRPNIASFHSELEGGVVGAQASLHVRARESLTRSVGLLHDLRPLLETTDEEVCAALKSVIETEFRELVDELGKLGGPRVPRVDHLWRVLLGPEDASVTDPDDVLGRLGDLRDRLGLGQSGSDERVNNADEEQQLTSFRIIVDDLVSLRTSWERDKRFFGGGEGNPFLGIQLVQLERQLSVVAGSVDELRAALDSVLIDADERRTFRIPICGGSILLEDLLDWIVDFATQEGPRLVKDGGKLAISGALLPAATELCDLVAQAVDDEEDQPGSDLGIHSVRVQEALKSLRRHLDDVVAGSASVAPNTKSPPAYVIRGSGTRLGDWEREIRLYRGADGRYWSKPLDLPVGPVHFKVLRRTTDGETEYPEKGFQKDYVRVVGPQGPHAFVFDPRSAARNPSAAGDVRQVN